MEVPWSHRARRAERLNAAAVAEPIGVLNDIASSWYTNRIMWNLGLVDIKWLVIGFLTTVAASWLIREIVLRRQERRNRVLRVLLEIQAANTELLRLGSSMQIDIDEGLI